MFDPNFASQSCECSGPDYMRVPTYLRIVAGARFLIEASAGVRVFVQNIGSARGFVVRGYARAAAGSALRIESGGQCTAVGV